MPSRENMERDAIDENVYYRRTLKQIDDGLVSDNISAMKFLCRDFVPGAKLEPVSRGINLFEVLEQKQLLGNNNSALLIKLLQTVGRYDLAKLLEPSFGESAKKLSSYRVKLFKVCDDLTSKEVDTMKFMCEGHLKRKLPNVKTCENLLVALEESGCLSPDNTRVILELLGDVQREDLHSLFVPLQQHSSPQFRPILGSGTTTSGAPSRIIRSFQAEDELTSQFQHMSFEKGNYAMLPTDLPLPARQPLSPAEDTSGAQVTPSAGEASHLPPPTVSSQVLATNTSLGSYDMSADPRGICLIIDNELFTCTAPRSPNLKQRRGTRVDCEKLTDIFEKLRFQVSLQLNKTALEIEELMIYFSTQVDHALFSCFICCILTHGKLGKVYGTDGATVDIMTLTSSFKGAKCQSLVGKPKLFFIQACQGLEKQTGVQIETDAPESISQTLQETIPNESDFLVGFATVPGFVSYRSTTDGTWYISKLVEMINAFHTSEHLLDILIKVNDEVSKVAKETSDMVYKQAPAPLVTLRKKVFFR